MRLTNGAVVLEPRRSHQMEMPAGARGCDVQQSRCFMLAFAPLQAIKVIVDWIRIASGFLNRREQQFAALFQPHQKTLLIGAALFAEAG